MDHTIALIQKSHEGDEEARAQIVEENTGLVWCIVRRFTGRGTELEDLFQIGTIGLMKSIEMSRAWCCNTTHLERRNLLREQIMQDVFGRQLTPQWNGRWFFSLFNILFLLGYDPETSYEKSHRETWVTPDEQYIDFLMEHMLPSEEHTLENVHKITDWIHTHLNEDGQIKEVTHSAYGRILWDVRNKTVRPDYRTVINDSMAK